MASGPITKPLSRTIKSVGVLNAVLGVGGVGRGVVLEDTIESESVSALVAVSFVSVASVSVLSASASKSS